MKFLVIAVAAGALLAQGPAARADEKPLTFRTIAMGEIDDTRATSAGFCTRSWSYAHFGMTLFKVSNGNALTVYYGDFIKPEEAKRFLDWKANKSFKVLSQSTKTDPNGKSIEYRMELVPESDRADVELMWVVGVAVHWIHARTLQDAVELERQYRK
jgi:hypothetical protein